MLASDLNNHDFAGAANPDAFLSVKFYEHFEHNAFKSDAEGRPIYDPIDKVQIFVPGDSTTVIDTLVHEDHKRRFPQQWALYQNNKNASQIDGTLLSEWSQLSKAQAEQLKAIHFYTVENIANAPDAALTNMGMIGGMSGFSLRDRAKAYLASAERTKAANEQARQLEARDQEINELKAMVQSLAAKIQGTSEEAPKRGRKKAVEEAPEEVEQIEE